MTFKSIGIFSLGAATGAFVMYKYLNNKWNMILQDEVDTIKEIYEHRMDNNEEDDEEQENEEENVKQFRSTLNKTEYNKMFFKNESDEPDPVESESPPEDKSESMLPYIISEDAETPSSYSRITLVYYKNADILAEEDTNEIIEDVEYTVGREFINLKEQIEDEDAVIVRNEKLSTDFEIIIDYSDIDVVGEIFGYDKITGE